MRTAAPKKFYMLGSIEQFAQRHPYTSTPAQEYKYAHEFLVFVGTAAFAKFAYFSQCPARIFLCGSHQLPEQRHGQLFRVFPSEQ